MYVVPTFTVRLIIGGVDCRLTVARIIPNALVPPRGVPVFPGSFIRAADIMALRNALTEARNVLGMPLPPFTDPSLAGLPMRAVHIEELRNFPIALREQGSGTLAALKYALQKHHVKVSEPSR